MITIDHVEIQVLYKVLDKVSANRLQKYNLLHPEFDTDYVWRRHCWNTFKIGTLKEKNWKFQYKKWKMEQNKKLHLLNQIIGSETTNLQKPTIY